MEEPSGLYGRENDGTLPADMYPIALGLVSDSSIWARSGGGVRRPTPRTPTVETEVTATLVSPSPGAAATSPGASERSYRPTTREVTPSHHDGASAFSHPPFYTQLSGRETPPRRNARPALASP